MKRACTYGCRKYWTSWKCDKYCTCSCCYSPAGNMTNIGQTFAPVSRTACSCWRTQPRIIKRKNIQKLKQSKHCYKRRFPLLCTCRLAEISISIQRYYCHHTLSPNLIFSECCIISGTNICHPTDFMRPTLTFYFNISKALLPKLCECYVWEVSPNTSYTFLFFFLILICVQADALMINLYSCCIRPCPQYKVLPPLCSYSSSPITISSSRTGGPVGERCP